MDFAREGKRLFVRPLLGAETEFVAARWPHQYLRSDGRHRSAATVAHLRGEPDAVNGIRAALCGSLRDVSSVTAPLLLL